ncbi:hypothetical protein C0995_013621 [Termitomyces sp. Mi166|nr:hypothetical protein C0995_013621 [Termitomyces sp. Mi166\
MPLVPSTTRLCFVLRRTFHACSGLRSDGLLRSVAEENQDVNAMDRLLKVVSEFCSPLQTNNRSMSQWHGQTLPTIREYTSQFLNYSQVSHLLDHTSIMPLRTPVLWSEALLNASSAPGQTLETPPTQQDPLVPRNMYDSYTELILPFGSSAQRKEEYINASGGIRMGKLMEHLDSLAGSISYKHMLGPGVQTLGRIQERGFYIVTASVDRLDMLAPLNPSRDLRLSGQVIHTGRSSMEVAVKMETISSGGPDETVLLGRFSMVCRDANTHKARQVNPLVISTPEERSLFAMGEHMKKRRQSGALRSLSRVQPSSVEAGALHDFYLQYGQHDAEEESDPTDERVWMGDTKLANCTIMFPQERK